jgi:hypothetical protein
MECLNRISKEASVTSAASSNVDHANGFEPASKAVSSVVAAFQRQDDEEQSARLGRKNLQVMDRLAKMQAHKKNLLLKLASEYGRYVSIFRMYLSHLALYILFWITIKASLIPYYRSCASPS